MKINWSGVWESILANKGKLIAVVLAAVLILGAVLWLSDTWSTWSWNRGRNAKKLAVNADLEKLKDVQANIAADKKVEAEIIANVKRDAKDYLDAINATDAARKQVDDALKRMETAANTNSNVNAMDVENAMKGL